MTGGSRAVTDDRVLLHKPHGMNRLGRRFLGATLAVLGVAIVMIAVAAQAMFINDHDLRLLMWVLIPAVMGAAIVAITVAAIRLRRRACVLQLARSVMGRTASKISKSPRRWHSSGQACSRAASLIFLWLSLSCMWKALF